MPKPETIKRDVGEQSKGARLQKLRAVSLLLKSLERQDHVVAYCAVEFEGDVYLKELDHDEVREYHEEDKNYDPGINFTLASEPVINTLVIFADCWVSKSCSRSVVFGFYAPNQFTKERATQRTKRLQIDWPQKPMLELLQAKDFSDPQTLDCLKTMLMDEYRFQYSKTVVDEENPVVGEENHPPAASDEEQPLGNLSILEAWDDESWRTFLCQIDWKLGQEDHKTLELTIQSQIRQSKHYTQGLSGRESHIVSLMCDLLDQRQSFTAPESRFIHSAELEVFFLRVTAGTHRLPDPSYKTWEMLDKPSDTRNLEDKVKAVCCTVSRGDIGRWSRKATNSMNVQREYEEDVSLRSLKYQVFDVCDDLLAEFRKSNTGQTLTPDQITECVDGLIKACEERFLDCNRHYAYTFSGKSFFADMIWELIDSCYLAFDASAA